MWRRRKKPALRSRNFSGGCLHDPNLHCTVGCIARVKRLEEHAMTNGTIAKNPPNLRFTHMGLVVSDIEVMTQFYVDTLGFTITDRGVFGAMEVVFLSRDPEEHHQIVLTTGRPSSLPAN